MRPSNLAVVALALVPAAATAQVKDEVRRDLLGASPMDLSKVVAGLDNKQPESLTSHTPPWLRTAFHRVLATEATAAMLRQLADRAGGELRDAGRLLTPGALNRATALEGSWLDRPARELSWDDLLLLESLYAAAKAVGRFARILDASAPGVAVLALTLKDAGLNGKQLEQLADYLKKLPDRAVFLHAHAVRVILQRDDGSGRTCGVLRRLSRTYRNEGKPTAAILLMREALRRRKDLDPRDWLELARVYAQGLDPVRSRQALALSRREAERRTLDESEREALEERGAEVAELIGLAEKAFRTWRTEPVTNELKIELLGLNRQLWRTVEAGRLARELDKASVRDARIYTNLGLLCMNAGLVERASQCARAAADLPNKDQTFHALRAWLLLRPLLYEGLRALSGQGDPSRALELVAKMRTEVGILVEKYGREDFRLPHLVLQILADLTPAIRARDVTLAARCLDENKDRILSLREQNHGILGLQKLALLGAAAIQDRGTLRAILNNPTAAEATDPRLAPLRPTLALLLLDGKPNDADHRLARATFEALAESDPYRSLLLGAHAAMRAHDRADPELWNAAATHYRDGLTVAKLANQKATFLNNLAMCHYFRGHPERARESLAGAAAALADGENLAHLNAIVCAATLDTEALADLATRSRDHQWHGLAKQAMRWRIAAARDAGSPAAARDLAVQAVEMRFPFVRFEHPILAELGSFTFGMGLSAAHGVDLNVGLTLAPWLVRPAPITASQVDALAR